MKNILRNAALVVAGLLAGLLIAEVITGVVYPQRKITVAVDDPFFGGFDAEIGWTNRKNASDIHKPNPDEPAVFVAINGQGNRGPEVPETRSAEKKRILVLGDSITFGYGVQEEDAYPAQLRNILGQGYEVINAGVIGYALDQMLLLFEREGARYRPDVVVVGLTAGDIYELTCSMRSGSHKPFFRLVDGDLTLFNSPVPERTSIRDLLANRGKTFEHLLFDHSHLFRLLYYRLGDPGQILFKFDRPEMDVIAGMNVAAALFERFRERCRSIGCSVVSVVIPPRDWLEAEAAGRPEAAFVRRGHDAAVKILRDTGIPYLDLWDPFLEKLDSSLFLKNDEIHPNARGNRLIAEEIVQSGLLDRR